MEPVRSSMHERTGGVAFTPLKSTLLSSTSSRRIWSSSMQIPAGNVLHMTIWQFVVPIPHEPKLLPAVENLVRVSFAPSAEH
eukprot:6416494-Amphidinium_carterae.1